MSFATIIYFGFLLISSLAHGAGPFVASKAYWLDGDARATFHDALNAPFQTYSGSISEGYTNAALWVRVRIAGRDTLEPLALVVQPAFLQKIELYDPGPGVAGEAALPRVSGRDAKIDATNHIGLDNGFVIAASSQPRDIFLRFTTSTSLAVNLDVMTLETAERRSHVSGATLSIYFAFLLVFCLWGLVSWGVRRELIYGLFVLRQFFSMLHLFVFCGLLRYFFADSLSATARGLVYNVVTVTVIAIVGHFDLRLISGFGASRRLQKVFLAVLTFPAISLMLLLGGHTHLALYANSIIVNATMLMIILLAFSTHDREKKPFGRLAVLIVRYGYLLMSLVIVIPVLMHQNFIKTSIPMLNLLFLHAVISTIILFAVLSVRGRQLDLQAQHSLLQYQIKESELRQENLRRVEKEKFLSMLTHELRNPLAVIRLVTNTNSPGGKAVQDATLEMTRVLERVEQSERIDDEEVRVRATAVELRGFFEELADQRPVAARLDVEAPADFVITTDAALLRSIVNNLLENAAKYSPANSRIRLTALPWSFEGVDGVRLEVTNQIGDAGVPDAGKVFTKYYRSKGAHRQPGSGLGLFLVASWARLLGGQTSYSHLVTAE